MSDLPPNSGDDSSENAGWHQPASPGAWHTPEKAQVVGWRVPALPRELDEEPTETGGWHLPKEEDTTFSPEDQTDIVRSEDELPSELPAEGHQIAPEEAIIAPAPEDVLSVARQAEREILSQSQSEQGIKAPEDWMFMLEHVDTSDDEPSGTMSELIALANLQAEASDMQVELGDQLGSAEDFDESDSGGIDVSQLSTAERTFAQQDEATAGVTGLSAAEYARQQMARLQGDDVASFGSLLDESQADTGSLSPTGPVDDAEAYAKARLAELQQGDDVDASFVQPPQIEPLNPREQDLLRRFRETENQVQNLRQMQQSGAISEEDFGNRLRQLMILDDDQNWWMMGIETDTWYKSQGDQWVPSTPDVIERQQQLEAQSNTMQYSNQYSMDYLTGDQASRVRGYTEVSSPTGVAPPTGQTGYAPPIPTGRDVPIYDNEFTVPNPNVVAADELADPYSQATVPGAAYSNPTVAQPGGYGNIGTIESPYDESEPPDLDETVYTPLYDEVSTRQRASNTRLALLAFGAFVAIALLAGAGFIIAALFWYDGIVSDWDVQIAALQNYQPPFQSVTILDRAGNEIGVLGEGGNDRREVTIEEVSPFLIHAVLAQEDERYYQHPGWDMIAIVRAFWQNLTSGEIESGASTITQQIARNFVLQSTETSAERKITEIIVAGELTRRYSKSFLLELYLNEIAFGNQTFGVEAASRFYFNVGADDLNLPQSALLASLISAPSANNPVANRDLSFQLMRSVLQRMGEVGCIQMQHAPYDQQPFCLTPQQVDPLSDDPGTLPQDIARIVIRPFRPREFGVEYPHFIQLVQSELERYFGTNEIYRLGYTVTTTLDSSLQDSAQQQLEDTVNSLGGNGVDTGAIMVTDPTECTILAMVGSPDFNNDEIDGQVNGALQPRQPGSAIKPIIYAAALQGVDRNGNGTIDANMVDTNGDGIADTYEYLTPASILWDVQTTYGLENGQNYTPVNFDGQYHGPVALRYALQNSYNVPAVRAYNFIGSSGFQSMAESLGLIFQPEAVFGLPTALGATEVRLYDMMIAYGTFANGGRRCEFVTTSGVSSRFRTIQSIVDTAGNPVTLPIQINQIQAVRPGVAYLMNHILSDNQARAEEFTATSALTIPGITFELAAKSGTSGGADTGPFDLWTMGYTTNRVVGVWLGHHDGQPIRGTSGSLAAAPLWNQVLRTALQSTTPGRFPRPTGSAVRGPEQFCALTGALISQGVPCPSGARNEFWLESNPPPASPILVQLEVDAWTGLIANENCPNNRVTRQFVNVPDDAVMNYLNGTNQGRQYLQALGITAPASRAPTTSCDFNTTPPTISVVSPAGGETVQGLIQITGQVSADQFQSYVLEYANTTNPTQFFTIQQSAQPQPTANATLGAWNTTGLANGQYILRLTVTSINGGRVERIVQPVIVNNPTPTATPTTPALPPAVPTTDPNFTPIPFNDP